MEQTDSYEEETMAGTGLYCFRDAKRRCGPDCMAYSTDPPMGPDYQCGKDGPPRQWAYCMLLVNEHKMAKHLILVANLYNASSHAQNNPSPAAPFTPQQRHHP